MLKESAVVVFAEKPLTNNPFSTHPTFDQPLNLELCQQMYVTALRWLARDRLLPALPTLSSAAVHKRISLYGLDSCLLHPGDLQRMFRGVTLTVYQAIKRLYCSRLERSISMVTRILHAMAKQCDVLYLTDEAVWAVCLSLEKLRREATSVTIRQGSDLWWVGEITGVPFPAFTVPVENKRLPLVIGVLDVEHSHVLAVQTGELSCREQLYAQALYEAVSCVRRPDPKGAAGLTWYLPAKIATNEPSLVIQKVWAEIFPVPVETGWTAFPFLDELRVLWRNLFRTRDLPFEQWSMAFESALNRRYGTSPIRTKEENEFLFSHLRGYMSDPAWLFPALRMLLPSMSASITEAGTVCCHGLDYTDELLSYWPAAPVIVRPSAWDEATAWIYLDGEILCQAVVCQRVGRERDAFPSLVS